MFGQMLDLLPELTPMNQSRLLHDSTYSDSHRAWLFERIETDPMLQAQLGIVFQNFLRHHRDESIRYWAAKHLEPVNGDSSMDEKVKRYEPALQIRGGAERGKTVFQQRCATCHRAGDDGPETGPNLVTVSRAGRPALLQNILDPNREINSNYETWQIVLADGTELLGKSIGQRENSFNLMLADGTQISVPRADVVQMRPTGRSLMPEGLEEGLTPESMADLLRFIEDLAIPRIDAFAE